MADSGRCAGLCVAVSRRKRGGGARHTRHQRIKAFPNQEDKEEGHDRDRADALFLSSPPPANNPPSYFTLEMRNIPLAKTRIIRSVRHATAPAFRRRTRRGSVPIVNLRVGPLCYDD